MGQFVHFDIYLNGATVPGTARAALIKQLEGRYRFDRADAAVFVSTGQRIRIRRGVDQDAAMRSIVELQGLGAVVEVEPNRPPDEALAALDAFDQSPALDITAPHVVQVRRELESMGNAQREPSREYTGPTNPLGIDLSSNSFSLQTLDGAESFSALPPIDSTPALALDVVPQPRADDSDAIRAAGRVYIGRESTAETDPSADARFRPPDFDPREMMIDVDAPKPTAPPPPAPEPEEARLCEEHDEPEPCKTCAEEIDLEKPIPGRLMQGRLRQQPALRIGIGIVLGFGLGYLVSLPYAARAERRVDKVRAEANVDRYKNAQELRDNSALLDRKAEEMANSAAMGTIGIWLVIGGGVVAAWFRAT